MEYFKVTAKCGHVGRDQYYKGMFFIRAESGSEAAAIARWIPRVKHHHKDAILSVEKTGYAEFKAGQTISHDNPYFNCHSRQEQGLFSADIAGNIHSETNSCKNERRDGTDRQAKLEAKRRDLRKSIKYGYNYDI